MLSSLLGKCLNALQAWQPNAFLLTKQSAIVTLILISMPGCLQKPIECSPSCLAIWDWRLNAFRFSSAIFRLQIKAIFILPRKIERTEQHESLRRKLSLKTTFPAGKLLCMMEKLVSHRSLRFKV